MASPTQRSWCITWNNPPPEVITDFEQISERFVETHVSYAIWQVEKAASGTDHIQMYVELKKPQRFAYLKKLLDAKSLHCEARKGTRDQARDYCRKEDTRLLGPFEFGEWKEQAQGRRTDLDTAVNLVKEGKNLKEIYDELGASVFRNAKYLDRARITFASSVPRVKPVVIVHWGDSGTGKTHDAVSDLEPSEYFIKGPGKWWDGYDGQAVVLIDDIVPTSGNDGAQWYQYMLRLLDHYSMQVEIKGGSMPFNPTRIFLTSNRHPSDWFPDVNDKTPLFRRITSCIHYSGALYPNPVTKTEQNLLAPLVF